MKTYKKYLEENNFYAYQKSIEAISKSYKNEFQEVSKSSNKRNLHIKTKWEEIKSFGEQRKLIILDLGGTNLNIFSVDVKKNNKIKINKTTTTKFYKNKTYTPKILFTDLKKHLDKFIPKKEREPLENLVFIFSYPIEQLVRNDGYIDAICTKITKEHKQKGLVGLQIGKTFQNFLRKNDYPNINISVTNDTVINVLAAKGYEITNKKQFDAAINIIVGTGTNVACAYRNQIINTEFGEFKNDALSDFDKVLDKNSDLKGVRHNEKMISGSYQHQIFKIIVAKLYRNGLIPEKIMKNFSLKNLSSGKIEKMLKNKKNELKFIWDEINTRGGTLCGAFLSIVTSDIQKKLGKSKMKILIIETGSVIKNNNSFNTALKKAFKVRLGISKVKYEFKSYPNQEVYGAVIFDTFSKKK